MPLALHPQPTVWLVLFVLALLALVFLVIPAVIGLLLHRRRGGKDKS
jgi:hypothetical protein